MLTDEQLIKKYGKPGDPTSLTTITLPYPMRIAWDTTVTVKRIQCHQLIAHRLLAVFNDLLKYYGFEEIQRLGIDLFGGCVNFRLMRGSKKKWSRHSWGVAIDLDPARNALKTKWLNSQFSKPEYAEMVAIFERHGFFNLGKLKGYDSMHFEIAA